MAVEDKMIEKAVQLLRQDEVLGMPTETVYGLAGSIESEKALRKIFSVKGRPFFDPLIVHVASVDQAKTLVLDWPSAVQKLVEKYWPGPLTVVLPKSSRVNDLISSGLETVAIRMPRHPMALDLIKNFGVPLAAPSANKFGKTSPTNAEHVKEEFSSDGIFVLDGGPCDVGLESTVLSVQQQENKVEIVLLRAGSILSSEIIRYLEKQGFQVTEKKIINKKMAPGQMKHHYMPSKPLVVLEKGQDIKSIIPEIQNRLALMPAQIDGVNIIKPKTISSWVELKLSSDPRQAARELYSHLRDISKGPEDIIFFHRESWHSKEEWQALVDRMTKAASLII